MSANRIVDIVLMFLLFEAIALTFMAQRSNRWPRMSALVPNLLAGLFLTLALKNAVSEADPMVIGLCVALGGAAHGWDLWRRFHRKDAPPAQRPAHPDQR